MTACCRAYEEVLREIHEHPELHIHTFNEMLECSRVNGCYDARLITAHVDFVDFGKGENGVFCTVAEGPCECGAYHNLQDPSPREEFKTRQDFLFYINKNKI